MSQFQLQHVMISLILHLKLLKLKLTQSLSYKRISLPWELKSSTASKNLLKQRKKMKSLADSNFSSTRSNMIIVPFCFYTGLPSYEALIYFSGITKIPKMKYWKGENSLQEKQPYQTDDNKYKPGPSTKFLQLEEFFVSNCETKGWLACLRSWQQIWHQHQHQHQPRLSLHYMD